MVIDECKRVISDPLDLDIHEGPEISLMMAYRMVGRHYDPKVGRFISDDPLRQAGGSDNLQEYVGNNPINKLDPSGHEDDKNAKKALQQQTTPSDKKPSTPTGPSKPADTKPPMHPNSSSSPQSRLAQHKVGNSTPSTLTAVPSNRSASSWVVPKTWGQPTGISDIKVSITGGMDANGRIRLSYHWSHEYSQGAFEGLNRYEIVLPKGTSLATVNKLHTMASQLADDYGQLSDQKNLVKSMEQSRDILVQAGIAATTAGAGSALTAARASQVALVANAGRAGQIGIGGYFAYQGGSGALQGIKDVRQGNYLGGAGNLILGGASAVGGARLVNAGVTINPRGIDFENLSAQQLERTQSNVVRQVTVHPLDANGKPVKSLAVRLDTVGTENEAGSIGLTDAKATPSTPRGGLTYNQRRAYPLLQQFGGVVSGEAGGVHYPAGTKIPPTKVQIVRPENIPIMNFWMNQPALLGSGFQNIAGIAREH